MLFLQWTCYDGKGNVDIDQKSELRGSQNGGEGGMERNSLHHSLFILAHFFNVGDLEISKGVKEICSVSRPVDILDHW